MISNNFGSALEQLSRQRTKRRCGSSERTTRSMMTQRTSNISVGSTTEIESASLISIPQDDAPMEISDAQGLLNSSLQTRSEPAEIQTRKTVRFSTVTLRQYQLCLGDNPSVARGAPIALDWKHTAEFRNSIEDFEKSEHYSTSVEPRSTREKDMKRSSLERLHLLKDLGHSRMEIKEATNRAQLVRKQRFQTRRQVERSEKFHALLNALLCACRSFHPDTNNSSASVSTVSTRNNSVDWGNITTDDVVLSRPSRTPLETTATTTTPTVAKCHGTTKQNKTQTKTRRKHRSSKDWQKNLRKKLKQQREWRDRWQRRPIDSLDLAHHSAIVLDNMEKSHHPAIELGSMDDNLACILHDTKHTCLPNK